MIRTLIIDDEKNATDVLELQIANYCDGIEVIGVCNSSLEGIKMISTLKPNLVLLDIDMPHLSGFDVIEATKDMNYKVIFTTAFNEFAIKAFKVAAVDYLLKPIDIIELRSALARVKSEVDHVPGLSDYKKIMSSLSSHGNQNKKIALQSSNGMKLVEVDQVVRAESESNYTHVYLSDGKKITLAKTLKSVEEALAGFPFCRVHQSHLINVNFVNKIIKGDNPYVLMLDGTSITVSRQRKDEFYDLFKML